MKHLQKRARIKLRGNLCSSIFAIVMPALSSAVILLCDLFIFKRFLPFFNSPIKTLAILGFLLILRFVFYYPLCFGAKRCFYQNCTSGKISMRDVFFCYSSAKAFWLSAFCIALKKFLLFAVAFITVFPLFWLMRTSFLLMFSAHLQIACCFAFVVGVIAFSAVALSLFLTEYIVVATGKNPLWAAVKSVLYMHRKREELVLILLKFTPLFLCSIFVFPLFYILPLFYQSVALFANDIIFYSPLYSPSSLTDI